MAIPRCNSPAPRPEGLIIIVGDFFGLKKRGLYSKKLMNGGYHLRNIPAELMSINSFPNLELLEVQHLCFSSTCVNRSCTSATSDFRDLTLPSTSTHSALRFIPATLPGAKKVKLIS